MLRAVRQVDIPGVVKYVRLAQVPESEAEAYEVVKFDGRKMGVCQLLWEMMDCPRCEVRLP